MVSNFDMEAMLGSDCIRFSYSRLMLLSCSTSDHMRSPGPIHVTLTLHSKHCMQATKQNNAADYCCWGTGGALGLLFWKVLAAKKTGSRIAHQNTDQIKIQSGLLFYNKQIQVLFSIIGMYLKILSPRADDHRVSHQLKQRKWCRVEVTRSEEDRRKREF